jgi:uncharacterized protein (TIGR03118 family)
MRKHLFFAALVAIQGAVVAPAYATFIQTNLVSDISTLAPTTDPDLKNPWGMSFSATSPMWVSNQGSNTSTLYDPLASSIKVPLTVAIPTAGIGGPAGPTGQVFNSTAGDFMIPASGSTTVKALFLFDTLDGTIQGWNPGSNGGPGHSEIVATVQGAHFTGLALGNSGGSNYLYAADATGQIHVFDSTFHDVTGTTFAGKFVDPAPIAGFTPFNIQNLDGHLFVTFAASTPTGAPLPGGFVDEFDMAGNLVARIASGGPLNAPWGLAIAPSGFGMFGGDLLVGNLYDSRIDAFDLSKPGVVEGSILVNTGFSSPVGLWALDFGNGRTGNLDTLYFTSGINNQIDGLFGEIRVPESATLPLVLFGFVALLVFLQRRRGESA